MPKPYSLDLVSALSGLSRTPFAPQGRGAFQGVGFLRG